MKEWEFSLVLEGDLWNPVMIEKLDTEDATIGVANGVAYADFVREAPSLPAALISAIRDVESVPGLRVLRVEPDDLVTATEIAQRLGRSRESVRLLASGERGGGDFPPPISHLRSRGRLWRWSDVASWADRLDEEERGNARFVGLVNAALELRERTALDDDQRKLLESLAVS